MSEFLIISVLMCAGQLHAVSADESTGSATGDVAELLVYVGTYTGGKSKGIYIYRMDMATGALTSSGVVAHVTNPSFLAIHANRRFLYAVNEVDDFEGKKSGAVSAFAVDLESGSLEFLNQQATGGDGPCHLVVDGTGRYVLVANYGGGSVAVLPIEDDGQLGKATAFIQHQGSSANSRRQQGPHAHSINLDASNRFACVADLGLDKVLVYQFDATNGTLAANRTPSVSLKPGAGPRHFAFHPGGDFAYVINEIDSTITALAYDADLGSLEAVETVSTLPKDFHGRNSTAEVQVHPSGKFLYGSNRGHNSIVVYAIDPKSGKLTYVENEPTQGDTPRNFGIDPTGNFLLAANQSSDTIVVFRIDQQTGRLDSTGHIVSVPTPVCVKMMPKNR